jgi:hypothetical protein
MCADFAEESAPAARQVDIPSHACDDGCYDVLPCRSRGKYFASIISHAC